MTKLDGLLATLFPLGHAYFGYIDAIGRQNIIDLHPGVELTFLENKSFAKKLSLRGDYHVFWRQSDDDALYGVQGQIQRADNGTDERQPFFIDGSRKSIWFDGSMLTR